MRRDEALRILAEHREELRRQFGVRSLSLFGSTARNEASKKSDLDLLVEFDRPIGLFHLIGTQQHLERLLGVAKVDLVLRRSVIEELKENIFAEAINVFDTPEVEVSPAAHAGSGG
jgi:predicted nucleotidyltransferase